MSAGSFGGVMPIWVMQSAEELIGTGHVGRVLMIQEDSCMTSLFTCCLTEICEIIPVASIIEADKILRETPIDLIVFECTPRQFEEAQSVLSPASNHQGLPIPVVVVSSYERYEFDKLNEDQPLVIVGHIQKSTLLKDLLDQLTDVLREFFNKD